MTAKAAVVVVIFCFILRSSAERTTLFELPNPTYLEAGKQSAFVRAQLPEGGGLPLGADRQENNIFVWRNGVVTFGLSSSEANLSTPVRNFSVSNAEYLVAPLWLPSISPELVNITVGWGIQDVGDEEKDILEFAEQALDDYSQDYFRADAEFSPVWAMTVTWNISLIPNYEQFLRICRQYSYCRCQKNEFFSFDYSGGDNPDDNDYPDSSECPTEEQCFANNTWSAHDTDYLELLCMPFNVEFSYFFPAVQFQLILATDGQDTHALFLYKCEEYFYSSDLVHDFIGNYTSTGHRLGDTHDNYTCVNNDRVPSLLLCEITSCSGYFIPPDVDLFISTYLHNLTTGFEQFRQLRDLVEGHDYIQFPLLTQLLGFDVYSDQLTTINNASNKTDSYLPYRFVPNILDGASGPILHNGFGVGTVTQTKIYVGTNGIISFGRPYYFWYPRRFPSPYPSVRDTYVAAPFWHDVDIRGRGNVIYATPTPWDYPQIYATIDDFLRVQLNSTFKADWILLASWVEVPIYPNYYVQQNPRYYSSRYKDRILNDFNTFEAAIVTSGADTYVVYTYNCELLNNPGQYRGPVIGYNLGGFEFENHRYSESLGATRIACGNWPSSDWYNLIYKISTGEDEKLRAIDTCFELIEEDKKILTDVEMYVSQLSPCPCTIQQAWRDRNYRFDFENYYCYYQPFANSVTGDFDQYCCYDRNFEAGTWGALVKSGYRASGMAKMVSARFGRRTISQGDLDMRRFCCGLAGHCDDFLTRRPPNDCTDYVAPIRPWGWGDPHIMTINGGSYTFNGYGEFVMLRYDNAIDFQARMRPVADGTKATQFSAFAFGYIDGDKVTIDCESADKVCVTWLNDEDISTNLTSVNDSYFSESGKLEVVRESVTTISVGVAEGIYLGVTFNQSVGIPSFQLNINPELSGSMVGLLGNKAGNLAYRDDTPLDLAAATDEDIFQFGNDWLITEDTESLFRYEPGEGPQSYHDSTWMPDFTATVVDQATDDVIAACTPAGATEPVAQCVFDATATGDVSIGMATTDTLNENNLAVMESNNRPPVINISIEGILTLSPSSPLTFTITVSDDNDDTPPMPTLVSPPPGASLSLLSPGYPGSFIFTWVLSSVQEDELSDVVILATDSLGAPNVFSPHVEICACENGGTCTPEGATSITDLLIVLNCICSPAWEGRYCERDVDGCEEYSCSEGVECFDVPAPGEGATCGPCPLGFTDDGEKCADIDECASEGDDASPCEQECTNTEGSYECSCYRGYVVSEADPSQCDDLNECYSLLDDCEQVCSNTEGSFNCSCWPGFKISPSNSRLCSPEQQCNADYAGCGSTFCANISGYPLCYCSKGYKLDASGPSCVDADECYGGSGPCLHYCTNLPGTFACSCREGYAPGSDPTSCKDIDECKRALDVGERLCYESEACINVEGSFDCVCAPGLLFIYNTIDSSFCGSLPPSKVFKDEFARHGVNISISELTVAQLEGEGKVAIALDLVRTSVIDHCATRTCTVERVIDESDSGITKRHAHLSVFDPTKHIAQPVPRSQDPSQNVLTFYVDVEMEDGESGALDEDDTLAAIQNNIELFEEEFGEGAVSVSLAYLTPPVTAEPPVTQDDDDTEYELNVAVVAGVTAAAGVLGLVLSVSVALGLYFLAEWYRKRKNLKRNRRGLLTECVSLPDGKGGGEREMGEVPPQGPRLSEDLGKTILFNEGAA